jgi:predicted transglutaminase-like cysteine proteinase
MTMPSPLLGIGFAGTHCIRVFAINTYITQQVSASAKKIAMVGFLISLHSHVAAFEVSEKLLEKVREQHGAVAEARLRNWKRMVKHSDARLDIEKLTLVNEFINRAHRVNDTDSWYKTDARADPLEFLVNHSGDGQDFTVAKLFTLHQMGVDLAKLRISYVKSNGLNRPHTVLAYFSSPTSEPLILDNVERLIKPSSAREDLEPIYLFDPRDVQMVDGGSRQLPKEKSNHIVKWQNLLPNLETVHY